MGEDSLIRIGSDMVRLIDDNPGEVILWPGGEPGWAQGLNTGNHDLSGSISVGISLFFRGADIASQK
jgi:hypothetical protein